MTEDNKPTWQYVPPTSPTEGANIDATRYMKGAPRRTAGTAPSNIGSTAEAPSDNTMNAQHNTEPQAERMETNMPEAQENTGNPMNPINYSQKDAPAASEYSTEQHSGPTHTSRREGGYHRDNGHNRGPRREGRHEYRRRDDSREGSHRQRDNHVHGHPNAGQTSERAGAYQSSYQNTYKTYQSSQKKTWLTWVKYQWNKLVGKMTGRKPAPTQEHGSYSRDENRGQGRSNYGRGPRRDGRSGGGRGGYRNGGGNRGGGSGRGGRSGGYNRGPRS